MCHLPRVLDNSQSVHKVVFQVVESAVGKTERPDIFGRWSAFVVVTHNVEAQFVGRVVVKKPVAEIVDHVVAHIAGAVGHRRVAAAVVGEQVVMDRYPAALGTTEQTIVVAALVVPLCAGFFYAAPLHRAVARFIKTDILIRAPGNRDMVQNRVLHHVKLDRVLVAAIATGKLHRPHTEKPDHNIFQPGTVFPLGGQLAPDRNPGPRRTLAHDRDTAMLDSHRCVDHSAGVEHHYPGSALAAGRLKAARP